jgi:UDP-glucose 4-epimerase
MASSRVLLTGACGFIGRHICRQARDRGYSVYGLDLVDVPAPELEPGHYFKNGDHPNDLARFVENARPEICIHAAGGASVADSVKDPRSDFRSGPVLTFELLDALRREAPGCRFLLLSSAAVYGNPESLPVTETQTPAPISPYGFHKLQCELLCREFNRVYDLRTSIVRIFSAYGEGLRRQVLWDICRQLATDGALTLRGTGQETRDFIHVTDVAAGVLLVAERGRTAGEVYNLASGRSICIQALAQMAAAALGPEVAPQFDGVVPAGDPRFWQADITRIKALGLAPAVGLEEGVADYAAWCQGQLCPA